MVIHDPNIIALIEQETERARAKHPGNKGVEYAARTNLDRAANILTEETGEVAEAAMDLVLCQEMKNVNCQPSREHLRKELVQVASVALRWLEVL